MKEKPLYEYTPAQPTLHESPVRFNIEISSTVDFWQYGPDCFSLFAHQRARYLAWLGFFEQHREVLGNDYINYVQALNFFMTNNYLIATQDDYAEDRSMLFMYVIADADLILENEITAQALLSIASFYGSYEKMNPNTFPLTGKIKLSDCVNFYRTCFDRHFQLPTCIALNKSIYDDKDRHIIAVLFENEELPEL